MNEEKLILKPNDTHFNLTLLNETGERHDKRGKMWAAKCFCGKETLVGSYEIKRGSKKSCGCQKYSGFQNEPKYGDKSSKEMPEYNAWMHMKRRCSGLSKSAGDASYIKRGITVCDRWKNSFQNFYDDMGPRPSNKYSIDRINNDENYEPSNCRWATMQQQQNNRSNNTIVEYSGRKQTVTQWAREFGMKPNVLSARLHRYGMSIEEALTREVREVKNKCPTTLEFNGIADSIENWSQKTGISEECIRHRLLRNWSVKRALSTKVKSLSEEIEKLEYNGETLSVAECSRKYGIPEKDIRKRLHRGWPVEKTLNQPLRKRSS
jgi:hypothetical protein